jgi:DnaJ-class molecular chaperone
VKDYYRILGVPPKATEDEIRRAYRRLALKHHPDRNPGDPGAEERFKEISEAYGVLMDSQKRAHFDQWQGFGARTATGTGRSGFRYTQEEIFQDLFRNPHASKVFQDLFKEFERAGVRFDQRFFDQMFFGGRGTFFGGVFVWGPFGTRIRVFGPQTRQRIRRHRPKPVQEPGFLERVGRRIGRYLTAKQQAVPSLNPDKELHNADLHYQLALPAEDLALGTEVQIAVDRGSGQERLKVRIPRGARSGTRLRLQGKGLEEDGKTGDLYLTVTAAG